jgi:hypothetical protein
LAEGNFFPMNKLFPFSDAPQQAVTSVLQTWMQDHPIVAWLLVHPLWSLLLLLVVVVLLRGLIGAIGRLTERIWIALLQAPMRLATWLLTSTTNRLTRTAPTAPSPLEPTPQQRLIDIVTRLEAIQQEQDALLKEVREMLGDSSIQLTGENR